MALFLFWRIRQNGVCYVYFFYIFLVRGQKIQQIATDVRMTRYGYLPQQ